MADDKSKTVNLNHKGIDKLPDNKPVVYKILNSRGDNVYTGVAGRGNVQDRIADHLSGGSDPIPGGTKVQIQQKSSIREAGKTEQNIISRTKPRYNEQGK